MSATDTASSPALTVPTDTETLNAFSKTLSRAITMLGQTGPHYPYDAGRLFRVAFETLPTTSHPEYTREAEFCEFEPTLTFRDIGYGFEQLLQREGRMTTCWTQTESGVHISLIQPESTPETSVEFTKDTSHRQSASRLADKITAQLSQHLQNPKQSNSQFSQPLLLGLRRRHHRVRLVTSTESHDISHSPDSLTYRLSNKITSKLPLSRY